MGAVTTELFLLPAEECRLREPLRSTGRGESSDHVKSGGCVFDETSSCRLFGRLEDFFLSLLLRRGLPANKLTYFLKRNRSK
jgi:hypothetical protein